MAEGNTEMEMDLEIWHSQMDLILSSRMLSSTTVQNKAYDIPSVSCNSSTDSSPTVRCTHSHYQ